MLAAGEACVLCVVELQPLSEVGTLSARPASGAGLANLDKVESTAAGRPNINKKKHAIGRELSFKEHYIFRTPGPPACRAVDASRPG